MDITEDFLTNSSELKFKEMRVICLTLGNIHVKKNPPSLVCLRWQPQRSKCAYRLGRTPSFRRHLTRSELDFGRQKTKPEVRKTGL